MDLSVIIPTHRRAEKLAACVASLAGQELDGSFEVLVGVDGPEDPPGLTQRAAIAAWAGDARLHLGDRPRIGDRRALDAPLDGV